MAIRRAVIRHVGQADIVDVLGYHFTILAAFRKYCSDNILLQIYLEADQQRRGMNEIGGELVDNHLNKVMRIFIGNDDTGDTIEFI